MKLFTILGAMNRAPQLTIAFEVAWRIISIKGNIFVHGMVYGRDTAHFEIPTFEKYLSLLDTKDMVL